MKSKQRLLLAITTIVFLLSILVAGCGGESSTTQADSTAAQHGDTRSLIKVLSPNGVAMVNGKEISKADLDARMSEAKDRSAEARVASGGPSEMPEPGTPEYANLERNKVWGLIVNEIYGYEAVKMGIKLTEAEINAQIDRSTIQPYNQKYGADAFSNWLTTNNKTIDQFKYNARKVLIYQKLLEEVTKNVSAGANESETANNKRAIFNKWFSEAENNYYFVYAAQYEPTSTSTSATK